MGKTRNLKIRNLMFVAGVLSGAGGPACAGWQGAEWGMTAAQVRVVHPKALEAYSPGASSYLRLDGPVVFGGTSWGSALFLFDVQGRLRSVSLTGSESFRVMLGRLSGQLGAPALLEEGKEGFPGVMSDKAIFRDLSQANTISLNGVHTDVGFGVTTLIYERLGSEF